jgi:hypothetical protein
MASSSASPVDTYGLHCGPFLNGTPDRVDGQLLRLALEARHHRPGRLHSWWQAIYLPRRARLADPAVDVSITEGPVTRHGPVRAESVARAALHGSSRPADAIPG